MITISHNRKDAIATAIIVKREKWVVRSYE
jgi:phosphopantetheinyl transferase (holo-ACP synthase)